MLSESWWADLFRIRSKCLAVHDLSFFMIRDDFLTPCIIEVFSKHSKVYGSYILYKLKIDSCRLTI